MNSQRDPCAGCVYQVKVGDNLICDFLCQTGHRRPCPFGTGCTVKQTKEGETVSKRWDVVTALKLYEEGKTDPEIAKIVGVSDQTIKAWRKREGLKSNYAPAFAGKPKATAAEVLAEPDAAEQRGESGPEAVLDEDGPEPPGGSWPTGPVELHVELYGGWPRLRAPDWEKAARLWRRLRVCIEALGSGDEHG